MSKLKEICAKFALKVPEWSDLPPGWAGLLESALKDMLDAGWKGSLDQVKEKFGGLRIYYNLGEQPDYRPLEDIDATIDAEEILWNELVKIVSKAEKESFKTCQDCGQPGQLLNNSGWLMTLCPECFEKRKTNEQV